MSRTAKRPVRQRRGIVLIWKNSQPLANKLLTTLTKRRVLREAFHTHGLARNHINDGSVSRLERFGVVLQLLAGAAIDLLLQLCKLAGDVSRVTVQHGSVASADLTGVIEDDHLRSKDAA